MYGSDVSRPAGRAAGEARPCRSSSGWANVSRMMIRTSSPLDDGDGRVVAVAALHQLAQPGADARLHLADLAPRRRAPPAASPSSASSTASPGESGASWRAGPDVDEAGVAGLAHLLDEMRRPMPSPACRRRRVPSPPPQQDPQPRHVALGDPVGGVALERALVGVQRLVVAAELGEGLAEPVVGIGVAARARAAPGWSRPPPPTLRGWPAQSRYPPAACAGAWWFQYPRASSGGCLSREIVVEKGRWQVRSGPFRPEGALL